MKKIRYLYRTLSVLFLIGAPISMFLLGYRFTNSDDGFGISLALSFGALCICAILTLIVFWITRE